MSQNVTKQEHYRHRAASYSTRGARTGVNLLGWESPEHMTPEEEREAILARIRQIESFLKESAMTKAEKRPYGQEIHRLHQEMRKIRPGMQNLAPGALPNFILSAVKADVTIHQWTRYVREGQRLLHLSMLESKAEGEAA